MRLKKLYSSREVASLTGLSARQLQWWHARRLFVPSVPPHRTDAGGFTERRYTPVELLELMVLVQAVLAVADLVGGAEVDGLALFLAYLVFALIVLPVAAIWALGEPNRWSGAVVDVAALALAVTMVRMDAVWIGRGA